MIYLYHPQAGIPSLSLTGETFTHVFKSRRSRNNEILTLSNCQDNTLYHYIISQITKKEAFLTLSTTQPYTNEPHRSIHLGWAIIDISKIEKTLPFLNELGLTRLSFVHCERSQGHFQPDYERLQRILISSNQQCGRNSFMKIDSQIFSFNEFITNFPNTVVFDPLASNTFDPSLVSSCLIGPEGGFSEKELSLCSHKVHLNSSLILRSETATLGVLSKILL